MANGDPFDAVLDQYVQQNKALDNSLVAKPQDDPIAKIYDTVMGPAAQAKAVAGTVADPNKAAEDLNLSNDTGFPTEVVKANPERAALERRLQQASSYVGTNRYLQAYVNKNDSYAEISNDDWENLDNVSKALAASGFADVPGVGVVVASPKLAKQLPPLNFINDIYQRINANREAQKVPEDFKSTEEYYQYLRDRQENEGQLTFLLAELLVGGGAKFPGAADIMASTRVMNDFLKNSHTNVRGARWHPEFDDFLASMEKPLGPNELARVVPGTRPGEVEQPGMLGLDEETGGPRPQLAPPPLMLAPPRPTTVTEDMIRAGHVPPTGIDPLMDKLHQAIIKHDLDTFDQVMGAVQAANTYGRSQKAVSEFLQGILKETSVAITREAVENLYNKVVPSENDGLLGYDPNLLAKMESSRMSGVDIRIPMADYLAYTKPEVHSALRDDLRLRTDGITRNEAMELESMKGEEVPRTLEQGIRKSFYFQPMFIDQRPMGIPAGMYTKYFNKIVKEGQARLDKIWKAAERDVKREQTPEWKANRERITRDVSADVRYDPGVRADRALRMSELPNGVRIPKAKLHAPTLERYVQRGQLPRELLEKYGDPNGSMPDAIATMLDFKNGAELINALSRYHRALERMDMEPKQYFDHLVRTEVAKRMKAQYGDPAQNVYDETLERVLAEDQIEVFVDQLYMIAHLAEVEGTKVEAPMSKGDMIAGSRALFRREKATDANFEYYRKSAEKSGRLAVDRGLSNKWVEAFKHQQEQIISTYMAKHAIAFEKRMEKLNKLIDKYSNNNAVKGVAQEYVNQIHAIFEEVGLPTLRNPDELARAIKLDGYSSLVQFVATKKAAGYDPSVDTELINLGGKGRSHSFNKYTVGQVDAFAEAIQSLERLGRVDGFIQSAGREIDVQIARQQVIKNIAESGGMVKGKWSPRHPGKIMEKVMKLRDFDALLTKPEQVADMFDNNDPLGPFNTYVFRALTDGQHAKNAMIKELGTRMKNLPRKNWINKHLTDKLENNTLVDWETGEMREMQIADLLGMMFHMGNESNFGMLTKSYRVGTGPNSYVVGWDPMAVKAFVDKNATKEMWDFVQGVWDLWEEFLWPKMEAMARQVSGVPPTKIEARPIQTRFGVYKGGYSPLQADPKWIGEAPGAEEMFGMGRWFRALPGRHWEYERTNAAYPLDLKYNAQVQRLSEAVHDLTMRQPLIQAWKIVGDQQVQLSIRHYFGEETRKQMVHWLRYISNGKLLTDDALTVMNDIARWTHDKVVVAQLLYRASTIAKHSIAAGVNSAAEVGMGRYSWNFLRLYGSPDGWRMLRDLNAKMPFLRDRMHDMDRDLGMMYDKMMGSNRYYDYMKFFGGWAVAMLDKASANPTALTAFQKALMAGMDEQDAIYVAGKAVRNAHGAAGLVDLAPIQRGNDWQRLVTIAYSFFNHNYNRLRMIGRQAAQLLLPGPPPRLSITDQRVRERTTAREFIDWMRLAYKAAVYLPITGMLTHMVAKGIYKNEDEETSEALLRHMSAGTVEELLGPIPFARNVSYPAGELVSALYGDEVSKKFFDPVQEPFTQVLSEMVKGIGEGFKLAFGHEARRLDVKDMILATHLLKSIPGAGQAGTTAQFWADVEYGLQKADTPGEIIRGTLFGKSHPEEPVQVPRAPSGRHWGRK
jgi:hypothetical protein